MSQREDDLAYGHYYEDSRKAGGGEGGGDLSRGFIGDTFKMLKQTYKSHSSTTQHTTQSQQSSSTFNTHNETTSSTPFSQQGGKVKSDKLGGFLDKLQGTVAELGSDVAERLGTAIDPQGYAQYGASPNVEGPHRFESFAPTREHNDVKYYVDGCNYFHAVSKALENARESIWILDWWLSPELYLRRPPAKNEQYRVDRMLQAAAQRGVKVNIIVYKEVTQALTLSSSHTKHALEALHPNIAVFRHPDHLPDRQELTASITSSLQNLVLDAAGIAKLPGDALKGLYGMADDVILYWAHHEKLCLIDGRIAFMGGLDMCYGRWDTHQHAIADVHPADLNENVFPGQDYNNARVLDFQDVVHWEKNQLDRKATPRMGWSDVSVSLHGIVVEDLRRHFVERWNFIYDTKYEIRKDQRYSKLVLYGRPGGHQSQSQGPGSQQQQQQQQQLQAAPTGSSNVSASQPAVAETQQQPAAPAYQQTSSPSVPSWQAAAPQTQQQQQPAVPAYQQSGPSGVPSWQAAAPQIQQSQQQPPVSSYQPASPQGRQPQQQPHVPSYQPGSQGQQSQQQPHVPSYQPTGPQNQAPPQGGYTYTGQSFPPPPPGPPPANAPSFPPPPTQPTSESTRGLDYGGEGDGERGLSMDKFSSYGNIFRGQLAGQIHQYQDLLTSSLGHHGRHGQQGGFAQRPSRGNMTCQIVRSCSKWSHGVEKTEHSVADAYAAIIRDSQHFVYIENQFFITATSDAQKPVQNKIGAAIVERILRAARAGQKYKIIVVIPSVPAFAGDLRDDSTLGTRAIMEFQYNSINRGGNSIMELIAKEGFNPMDYIRFYNLRNYDRINVSGLLLSAQQGSGVNYEDARMAHDMGTVGQGGMGPNAPRPAFDTTAAYQQAAYQATGGKAAGPGRWDSVSECYMLGGEDIRNVPWEGPPEAEIDAFVSEELYVHTKVLIADDRIVICGSANLNDRSQLGNHDSEIAIIIEDHTPVHSTMNGQPWVAGRFAAALRRELFRKHLGLLPVQDYQKPDEDAEPVGIPNRFDFESPESKIVADPLADVFQNLWNSRARTNTDVFRKVFHAVPDDTIRNWDAYKEFFEYFFRKADKEAEGKEVGLRPARYEWGHVVREDFPPGPEGVRQVKELLSQVKGTLVEMPLMFLIEEDVAKSGLALNDLTEPIYT